MEGSLTAPYFLHPEVPSYGLTPHDLPWEIVRSLRLAGNNAGMLKQRAVSGCSNSGAFRVAL